MGAIKDLWQSERGLVAIVLIAACTTLCALSRLTVDQWLDYTKWIFVTYAAAKTVTGTAALLKPAQPAAGAGADLLTTIITELTRKPVAQPNNPPPPDPSQPPAPATTH